MYSLASSSISPTFPSSRFQQFQRFPLSANPNPRFSPSPFSPFSRKPGASSGLCQATSTGPPSPEPEDPFGKDPTTGLEETFNRMQDGVQIFFAVLFWMSLFFWSCAWDGRDDSGPRKGSRFRR